MEKGIKVVVTTGPAHRENGSSYITVYADNYDDALQALLDYRSGKINGKDIPKTGLDVRTKDEIISSDG